MNELHVRRKELRTLQRMLERARGGAGGVAVVAGEVGIGKTTVVRGLAEVAAGASDRVAWGHAYETPAPALWPWTQALTDATGGLDRAALTSIAGEDAALLGRVVPALGAGGENAETSQFLVFEAVRRLASRLARVDPAGAAVDTDRAFLLVLEDMHWGDEDSIELLRHVGRDLAGTHLLVVATIRDAEIEGRSDLLSLLDELRRMRQGPAGASSFERIDLARLSLQQVAEVVREAGDLGREEVQRLWQATEGVPFYLQELLEWRLAGGALPEQDAPVPGDLPPAVRVALAGRLARLTPQALDWLSAVALSGREFRAEEQAWSGVVPVERDHLDAAMAARIIESTGRPLEYRFTHSLVRHALLGRMDEAERLRLHGRLGAALAMNDPSGERAAEAAHHLEAAAALDRSYLESAAVARRRAGDRAAYQTAWMDAAANYARAESLLVSAGNADPHSRAALLTARGRSERNGGRLDAAVASLERAIEAATRAGEPSSVGTATLELLEVPISLARKSELVRHALEVVDDSLPELRSALLLQRAIQEPPEERAQALAELLAYAGAHDLDDLRLQVRDVQWSDLIAGGEFETARAAALETHRGWDGLGRYLEACRALRYATMSSAYAGDLAGTVAAGRTYEAYARTHGFVWEQTIALVFLAGVALVTCRLAEGSNSPSARRVDGPEAEALLGLMPGRTYFERVARAVFAEQAGRPAEGARVAPVEDVLGTAQELASLLTGTSIRLLFRAGEREAAAALVPAWWNAIEPLEGPDALYGLSATEDWLANLGDESLVRRVYRLLTERWRHIVWSPGAVFDVLRGELALRLGRVGEASEHFARAQRWGQALDAPLAAGPATVGLAHVVAASGQSREARRLLAEAERLLHPHGVHIYDARIAEIRSALKAEALPDALTRREVEVLRLLAAGLTNEAVASRLGIAAETVKKHVASIYGKTGTSNRAAATSYAHRRGLVDEEEADVGRA